jgi:ribonuclease R
VPISALGREYFAYDPDAQTLTGERSGRVIGLGQRVIVRLAEAVPITGGLLFELLEVEGRRLPTPPRTAGKGAPRRKLAQSRIRKRGAAKRDRRR